MATIQPGRMTADPATDVTVFLIGMRFNDLRRVRQWAPVFAAFPRMLRHLEQDPDSGLLGSHLWFGRTTLSLQYWTSPEALQAFASDRDKPHLEPWRRFRRLGGDGSVGIWHETYRASAGTHETIYVDMPAFGLAGATGARPIGPGLATAHQRLATGAAAAAAASTTGPAARG